MIKIKYLSHFPIHTKALSEIWVDTIGKDLFPKTTSEMMEADLKQTLNDNKLPLSFVALDDNDPIGMCSLSMDDGVESVDFGPWLCDLCIKDSYRKRGMGKLLINSVKSKAFRLGFKKLYLISFSKELVMWYEELGWHKIGQGKVAGLSGDIMEVDLTFRDLI